MTAIAPPADLVVGPADALVKKRGSDVSGRAFTALLWIALIGTLFILAVLLWDMVNRGWPVITTRFWEFLTTGTNPNPEVAGIWQGLVGTFLLCVIVAVVAFPLGVAAGVYLEEYAKESRLTNMIKLSIRNLAGVPSIVFGLLGLSIFVKALSGAGNQGGLTGGRTIVSGGLTLAALVLPIVIITTQEALRAVPAGIREGSLALGATDWETIRHHTVPAAASGILTGTVLSLARAAGEAAPLILVGASTGFFSTGNLGPVEQLREGAFTAMPVLIYTWSRLPASQGWPALVGAASIVLIAMVFLMNGIAIYLRNRYEQKW